MEYHQCVRCRTSASHPLWPSRHHCWWVEAVRSFKPNAASGPCGWSRQDLLHLTDLQVEHVLQAFKAIEHGAGWPLQWCSGLIHLLQKKETGSKVDAYRPITVLSMFYRTYAGLRAGQLLHHLSKMSAAMQCGFLSGHQAKDVWYFVGACLETSLQQGSAHGLVGDLVKAYNCLPRKPVFNFLRIVGIPSWFLDMWSAHLDQFQRYFVVQRSVSVAVQSRAGFPEGCPLSCAAMTVVDQFWRAWQSHSVPRCMPHSYVDNLEIICDRLPDLLACHDSLVAFCRALDLDLDLSSLYFWSSDAGGRRELRSAGLKVSLGERDLGGQVSYSRQLRNKVLTDRIEQVYPFFSKIRSSSLAKMQKIANIKQVLWPRAVHGCEATQLATSHLAKLRSGAMKALRWNRAGASPWIRISLLHRDLDPGWFQLWQVFAQFRHQCRTNRVIADWWTLFGSSDSDVRTHGPFGKLQNLLSELQLTLDEHFRLWFSPQGAIDILQCSDSLLKTILVRKYQSWICAHCISRDTRPDLQGFDEEVTLWHDQRFTPVQQEQLMIVRDGSFFTDSVKTKWDARITGFCPTCQVLDDKAHRYESCSKYDQVRAGHSELFQLWSGLPVSFQLHGLVPHNPWQELFWEAFQLLPSQLEDFQFQPSGGTTWHAFADGACTSPSCPSESLAAWAVTIADFGVLASGPLPGVQQSILRAELTAILSALIWVQGHFGSLHIWSDSQVAVDHLRSPLNGAANARDFEHSDIWVRIHACLFDPGIEVVVRKVYSHDVPDFSCSLVEDWCRFWNNSVDRQAEIANQTRPRFFGRIWDRFVAFRETWKRRVWLRANFVLAVAAVDVSDNDPVSDEDCTELVYPLFEVAPNDAGRAELILQLLDHFDVNQMCRRISSTVFHQVAQWLSSIDTSSATMRWVSVVEMYVGFRLSLVDHGPLTVEGGAVDRYTPVTFAADFAYFRKVFAVLIGAMAEEQPTNHIRLTELNIFTPLPAFMWGWGKDLESQVFRSLAQFVGHRPIWMHKLGHVRGVCKLPASLLDTIACE